jgi:hypothetical protein
MTKSASTLYLILLALVPIFFLSPPILIGTKKIFISDFIWFLIPFFTFSELKKNYKLFFTLVAIFLLSYILGKYRPSLKNELEAVIFKFNDSDLFDAKKELVYCFRFLSWATGLYLLAEFYKKSFKSKTLENFIKIYVLVFTVACITLWIEKFFPNFRYFLNNVYHNDPFYFSWLERSRGFFASPVEGGSYLGLFIVIFWGFFKSKIKYFLLPFFLISLVLTYHGTASIAVFLSGILFLIEYLKKKNSSLVKFVPIFAIVIVLILFSILFQQNQRLVEQKIANLIFRFSPWKLQLSLLFRSPFSFLFGSGFPLFHSDQSFVFILIRLGFLGTFLLFLKPVLYLKKNWIKLETSHKSIILYCIILSSVSDFLIFRGFAIFCATLLLPIFIIKK